MKLQFVGCGNYFTLKNYHSNIVLHSDSGKKLLIDAGTDIRYSLNEADIAPQDIDSIYISHEHADHADGLEYIAAVCYFGGYKKPHLFAASSIDLSTHFQAWRYISGKETLPRYGYLEEYVSYHPISPGEGMLWENIHFRLCPTWHIVTSSKDFYHHPEGIKSHGLFFEVDGVKIYITTDTIFDPQALMPDYEAADVIFHDCEMYETRSGVHANIQDLRTLPEQIKKKMWLYHYDDKAFLDSEKGFRGFVRKGMIFDCKDLKL